MPRRRLANHAEGRISPIGQGNSCRRVDVAVARIASGSEGVVDVGELRACGLDHRAVSWRERNGRLHRIHEGVYAVGHPNVSLKGRFIAAVKASGAGAALSHRARAADLEIRPWTEREIEVTIPRGRFVERTGIQVHRSSLMTREDQMVRDGILVTNAVWTMVALASVLKPHELRAAVRNALGLKLVSVPSILRLLARLGPVRGARTLREILARALPTRSELEDVVYDLIVSGGFVPPEVNEPLRLDGRVVIPDFRWPEHKLVVEADGARWHDDALARADDADRQALLERHGETVVRVRWDEATLRPAVARGRIETAGAPFL